MAIVATDRPDYSPGDTAQVYAADFQPGEAVTFQVLHNDGASNSGSGHQPWTVADGGPGDLDGRVDGKIHTSWYVNPDDSLGASFLLTASGATSGLTAPAGSGRCMGSNRAWSAADVKGFWRKVSNSALRDDVRGETEAQAARGGKERAGASREQAAVFLETGLHPKG